MESAGPTYHSISRRFRRRVPRELRFKINRACVDGPVIGEIYLRARSGLRPLRAESHTDLVVDGFPRSANTYALFALRSILSDAYTVRGHTHSARNVLRAVRMDVPTILVVREPRATIASLVQLAPGLSVATAARGYASFHERLLSVASDVVVADFLQVTSDIGPVLERVNDRFGTTFPPFVKTPEREQKILQQIEATSFERAGGVVRESSVPRPSIMRKNAESVLLGLDAAAEDALGRAERTYSAISRWS